MKDYLVNFEENVLGEKWIQKMRKSRRGRRKPGNQKNLFPLTLI